MSSRQNQVNEEGKNSTLKLITEKNWLTYLQTLHLSEIHFCPAFARQFTDFRFILLQNLMAKVVSFGLQYFMKGKTSNTNLSEREFGKVSLYSILSQRWNLSRYALYPTPTNY